MSLQQDCFECSKPALLTCQQCLNEFDEPKSFCLPCDRRIHGLLSKLTDHQRIDCRNNAKPQQQQFEIRQENEDTSEKEETRGTYKRDNNPFSSILKEGQYFQNRKTEQNQLRLKQQQPADLNRLQDYKKQNYSSPSNLLNNSLLGKDQQIVLSKGDLNEQAKKEEQKLITEGKRDNLLFFKDLKQLSPSFEQKKSLIPQSVLSSNQNKFSEEFENRYQSRQQQNNKNVDKSWDSKKFEDHQEKELENRRALENEKLKDTQTNEHSSAKQLTQEKSNEGLSFKEKLQKDIMALKQKQLAKMKEEERAQESKEDKECNQDGGYEKEQVGTAQEEYREVKQDLQKYFGNQSDIDARENDVLKRITEIKTRLSKGTEQISNIRNTTLNSYEINKEEKAKEDQIPKRSYSIGRYQDGKIIDRTNSSGKQQVDQRISQKLKRGINGKELNEQFRGYEKEKFQDNYFQKKEPMELDTKQMLRSREQEGVVSSLRQHMDIIEERNSETIRMIQTELLKEQRRNAENEQQWRNIVAEIKAQFETEVNSLRIQVQAEKARVIASEREIEDQQAIVSHKLFEAAEAKKRAKQEVDDQRQLMEERMQEMDALLERARTEGREEAERNLLEEKEDLEMLLVDLQEELRVKSEESKQKEDKIGSENTALQGETSKLNRIITDLKTSNESLSLELAKEKEEKQQLRNIAVIQEGELEVGKRQELNLEEQIKSLKETNELLDKQLEKYKKQIYGHKKDKSKSSLKKISSLSNASLGQITHTTLVHKK